MRIDGRAIAQNIYIELAKQVASAKKGGKTPRLAVILVGNDPASRAYVEQKRKMGEEIGVKVTVLNYPKETTEETLLRKIEALNEDDQTHGIIVQQPLPTHIDTNKIVAATDPRKDVDGFHEKSPFAPPIAAAVLEVLQNIYSLINHSVIARNPAQPETKQSLPAGRQGQKDGIATASPKPRNDKNFHSWLQKKNIIVIGKGGTGGKPIREAIEKRGAAVAVIDSKTEHPAPLLKEADIVISCVGRPNPVNFADLKKGAILIGVGMYRGTDGKLHADYDEKTIQDTAAYYTPVPGGIGPVNVAMLLKNVVIAAKEA